MATAAQKRQRQNPCTPEAAASTAPIEWTLPADLLLEIVARSDIRTFVCCAATCKLLRGDILNPYFVRRVTQQGGIVPSCILANLNIDDGVPPLSLVHPATPTAMSFIDDSLAPFVSRRANDFLREYSFCFSSSNHFASMDIGGFDMICSGRDKIETPEQFQQAEDTVNRLDLDGLVVIGGDDSNTNACLLGEYFRGRNLKTRVISCTKTIDGDLKCKEVPTSFGFDTAYTFIHSLTCTLYGHAIVRLMGRAASHITLECALQTHPNVALIGEEVAEKKETLKNVTDYITDVVYKRVELGYNYGVVLIPEGLIDFIPEIQKLIAELNEILAHDVVDEAGAWKSKLEPASRELFDFLPKTIQEQLLLERDPHGNVQVAKIETEKMLIAMVETELEKRRAAGKYSAHFRAQSLDAGCVCVCVCVYVCINYLYQICMIACTYVLLNACM
ncbi:pyrophosphate--fructose 6-phosphate 1-phosphotransferase subunit beta-like [Aegilops tauschii subsp. strangulata]|nr:pyrophosphate--fructose 6-phosphate 1-phosphotransferase subunit beta-like [Aegilops tauschii subsp. strangulata]